MTEADRTALQRIWQQISRRNDWLLVEDEAAFLEQVLAEARVLVGDGAVSEEALRVAARRSYSARLFRGLQMQEERAAQELWLAAFRLSIRAGWTQPAAEDLAQEMMARVIEKLPALRSPQSLVDWVLMILRTVQRDYRRQHPDVQQLTNDEGQQREPADPSDLAERVEAGLLSELITAELEAALPKERDRLILLRTVLAGDKPGEIAKDLGIPAHQVRLAKSRALDRLRNSPAFRGLLSQLRDRDSAETAQTGVDHHE